MEPPLPVVVRDDDGWKEGDATTTTIVVKPVNAFGRTGWRQRLADHPDLFAAFERLERRLVADTKTPHRDARAAVNHLVHFCRFFQDPERWPLAELPVDPTRLSGTHPDVRAAHDAWLAMQTRAQWRPAYFREVRTNLSRVLMLIAEPLAHVVNPRLYKGATGLAEFHVRRSCETHFLLHECLP